MMQESSVGTSVSSVGALGMWALPTNLALQLRNLSWKRLCYLVALLLGYAAMLDVSGPRGSESFIRT